MPGVSVQDVQYTDILLACTRHLLQEMREANPDPILNWLKSRLHDLRDILLTEISIDDVDLEVGLKEFAKLTATVRTEPGQRQRIRERLEPHTETLIQALNTFIEDGSRRLVEKTKLLVIVDNLDRIGMMFSFLLSLAKGDKGYPGFLSRATDPSLSYHHLIRSEGVQ